MVNKIQEERGFDERMNQKNSRAKNGLNQLTIEAAGNLWERPSSCTAHEQAGDEDDD